MILVALIFVYLGDFVARVATIEDESGLTGLNDIWGVGSTELSNNVSLVSCTNK